VNPSVDLGGRRIIKKKRSNLFDLQTDYIVGHEGWERNFDGKEMTLDYIRELAAKRDSLLFEDLRQYSGMNSSSNLNYCIMVYGVEGGYRLVVHSNATGKPDGVSLESIWDSGGSGIDIRYNNVDEFISANPSNPALTEEEARIVVSSNYSGPVWTTVDTEWWEYADEFPHHSVDPEKQALREALDAIGETCHLYMSDSGTYIAVERRYGTVYEYDSGARKFINPLDKPQATTPQTVQPTPGIRVTIEYNKIIYEGEAQELIYEDTHYKYSLPSNFRSGNTILTFEDGQRILLKDALPQRKISIEDLILNDLPVIVEPQDNPMGGDFNYYPLGEWSLNEYSLFPSNRFMYIVIDPDSDFGLTAYFAFDELIELIEMCGYKEQADKIREAYSVWSYRYIIEGIEYVKDSHLETLGIKAGIAWYVNRASAPVKFSFTS
jgi:hypothetical protein